MKKKEAFRKNILLAALAGVLILTPAVGGASAYFTTYTGAAGGRTLQVGSQPDIEEEFSGWVKTVTVTNSEGSQPVYVRARAFSGSGYGLNYQDETGRWTAGNDGFYYYSDAVEGGGATAPLKVSITGIPEDGGSFNVAVIYESTPVQYRADGTPYADWNVKLEILGASGTVGE